MPTWKGLIKREGGINRPKRSKTKKCKAKIIKKQENENEFGRKDYEKPEIDVGMQGLNRRDTQKKAYLYGI